MGQLEEAMREIVYRELGMARGESAFILSPEYSRWLNEWAKKNPVGVAELKRLEAMPLVDQYQWCLQRANKRLKDLRNERAAL
jgi:hypothetical protein